VGGWEGGSGWFFSQTGSGPTVSEEMSFEGKAVTKAVNITFPNVNVIVVHTPKSFPSDAGPMFRPPFFVTSPPTKSKLNIDAKTPNLHLKPIQYTAFLIQNYAIIIQVLNYIT